MAIALQIPSFEYHVVDSSNYLAMDEDDLNELGADGWELVSIAEGHCYFKRQSGILTFSDEDPTDNPEA